MNVAAMATNPSAAPVEGLARLLVRRPGVIERPLIRFALGPADRALVREGQTVFAGEPLLERVPDAALAEQELRGASAPAPGSAIPSDVAASPDAPATVPFVGHGRVLYQTAAGRLRAAVGQHPLTVASPVRGIVVEVAAGRLVVQVDGRALPGTLAAGEATRGELTMPVAGPDGELPPSAIDVGSAGAILVAGARIDLEALGRARAMGVRGVIVGGLVSRDLRGFRASEVRQRAALHGGPPFAVLVLDGYGKRAIAASTWARLSAAAGTEVAISIDPPLLLLRHDLELPAPTADRVRICGGDDAGREGTFVQEAGRLRWAAGIEAAGGLVRLDPLEPGAEAHERLVPLADLELLA